MKLKSLLKEVLLERSIPTPIKIYTGNGDKEWSYNTVDEVEWDLIRNYYIENNNPYIYIILDDFKGENFPWGRIDYLSSILVYNSNIQSLPKRFTPSPDLPSNLDIRDCPNLTRLPDPLAVKSVTIYHTPIKELPQNLKIGERLNIVGTDITELPPNLDKDLKVTFKNKKRKNIKVPKNVSSRTDESIILYTSYQTCQGYKDVGWDEPCKEDGKEGMWSPKIPKQGANQKHGANGWVGAINSNAILCITEPFKTTTLMVHYDPERGDDIMSTRVVQFKKPIDQVFVDTDDYDPSTFAGVDPSKIEEFIEQSTTLVSLYDLKSIGFDPSKQSTKKGWGLFTLDIKPNEIQKIFDTIPGE